MSTLFHTMCSDTMVQGVSINKTALHTLGRIEQVWENVLGGPELLGEPIHVPLRPGALYIPQVIGPRDFTVGMVLYGSHDKDQAGHNSALRTLSRLVWSPLKPLEITRSVEYTTGTEEHICAGQFVDGLNPEMIVPGSMSRLALRFRNLDGYWYSTGVTNATITSAGGGSITMPGDAETRRMLLTFESENKIQTLTNTTNGCMVTCAYITNTEPIDANVLAFTATQGSNNVVGAMTHAGDVFWMRLEPGLNEFTLTGEGSVTISARAAYL